MNRNVTLRQLRAFIAVGQEGSFTRAAARLHVTQSALTAAIKALEAEIGLRLFDRTTRAVMPTLHGERLLVIAGRMIDEIERAFDDLEAHAQRERGHVVVAATASLISHGLAPALGLLARRHPGITVRIIEENTGGASRRLLEGEADFTLTTLPTPDPAMESVPLLRDRFGVVCLPGHPLLRAGGDLPWTALRQFDLVGLGAESGIRAVIDRQVRDRFALPRPRHEVSSVGGLRSLVRHGVGIAAMPALAAASMTQDEIVFRPLVPAIYREVCLARRPGRAPTPAASALVSALLEHLVTLDRDEVDILVGPNDLERLGFEVAPARRLSRKPRGALDRPVGPR